MSLSATALVRVSVLTFCGLATAFGAVLPPVCVNSTAAYQGACGGTSLGSDFTIVYNGFVTDPYQVIPGLSAEATFSNFAGFGTNAITLSVSVKNTSTLAGTKLPSLSFYTSPDVTGGSTNNAAWTVVTDSNVPNQVGSVDFCFTTSSNCAAIGNDGLGVGQTATFNATLNFASNVSQLTFDNFFTRYGGFNSNGITSASGTAVPEPGWISLLGISAAGVLVFIQRRRKLISPEA